MYLDQNIAKELINTLYPFIDFDINIIDTDGIIIASTDAQREGTLHQGAMKLIDERLPIMVINSDAMYPGSRMGVNLPIQYQNQVIGVIGISGHPDNTMNYGKILQKMVEMLIDENFDTIQKSNKEASDLLLISDLIQGNLNNSSTSIESRIAQANLKHEGPFAAFLITTHDLQKDSNENSAILRENAVKNYILKQLSVHHILCGYNHEYYIAITNTDMGKLKALLTPLSEALYHYYHVSTAFFIGSRYNECIDIPKSYNEALLIYNQHYTEKSGIHEYDLSSLDLILRQIPKTYCRNLHGYIFKNCSGKDVDEACRFIRSYFKHNGSIKAIAEEEFIHKNTVQYRVDKIRNQTGMNLRNSADLFTLYIAALSFEE